MSKFSKKDAAEDFKINDEELDQLKEKYLKSYKFYKNCQNEDNTKQEGSAESKIIIKSKNRLFDLEPQSQDQTRQILLTQLQKSSFVKGLDMFPTSVQDFYEKKLGKRANSNEFLGKMMRHIKKKILISTEKQFTSFKRYSKFYSKYYNHENFRELKQMFDGYNQKLAKDKEFYTEMYYRCSHQVSANNIKKPEVAKYSHPKMLFSEKPQPPPEKAVTATDYRAFLNHKIREYKATRKVKKLKEVAKFYPIKMLHKTFSTKVDNLFLSSATARSAEGVPLIVEKSQETLASFQRLDNIEDLKTKLVALCQKFHINDDINIDNGALLLFRVDCYFKEKHPEQQKQLTFLTLDSMPKNENKKLAGFEMFTNSNSLKDQYSNSRVRYLKKATWVGEFDDFEQVTSEKKRHDIIYNDKFDSLLKACFEFVQIADTKEALIKIEFKLERLKDDFEQEGREMEPIFYEFLKAYMKMSILSTRQSIIKLYDSLNFFRSVERSVSIRKQEVHTNSKMEFEELIKTTIVNKMKAQAQENLIDDVKNDQTSLNIMKQIQDDEIVFHNDTIDILDHEQERIVYDVVQADQQKVISEVLRIGAALNDMASTEKLLKRSLDNASNNLDYEALLTTLLDYEASYQFEKAKYIYELFEIFQNTFSFKHILNLTKYMMETISKRPKFNLFQSSLETSYHNETQHYVKLTNLISNILSDQKEQENALKAFEKLDISGEKNHDQTPIDHSYEDNSKVSEIETNSLIYDKAIEREFHKFKAYDFLIPVFYTVYEVETSIKTAIQKLTATYNFPLVIGLQNKILDDINDAWQQIKYEITLVPAIKDYEYLECDVLLDIPNSYQVLQNNERTSVVDLDALEKKHEENKGHQRTESQKNMGKLKKKGLLTEEEYLINYIEFIRLKENLLHSLFSSAYSAQIYLEQTKLYGKEHIFKDLHGKPGNFDKAFLNLLINMENIQFSFDMKDLGDSKVILLNHNRMDELWVVAQYFFLHEILLQNALYLNYYHILDVSSHFQDDHLTLLNILRSDENSKGFFNIVEKKKSWLVQAKINPLLLSGKGPKNEITIPLERIKGKMESVFEFVKQVKHFILYETLKVQTISVARDLRQTITKVELEKKGIFELSPAYVEDANAFASSRGFDDINSEDNSMNPMSKEVNLFLEKYFDLQGRVKNIFIVPATIDLLKVDLDEKVKSYQNVDDYANHKRGSGAQDEDLSPKSKTKRLSKAPLFTNRELEFLNGSSLCQVLEVSHFLLQTLNIKVLESTLDSHPLDLLLLQTNGFDKHPEYNRNKLRVEQSFDNLLVWVKKFKEQAQNILSFSNPKDRPLELHHYLKNHLKREFLTMFFATIETLSQCRQIDDHESVAKLRSFFIKLTFHSLNHFYKIYDRMCHHKSFGEKTNKIFGEVDIQDSDIMELINFIFLNPHLDSLQGGSDWFFKFIEGYSSQQENLNYGLFDLKKSAKSYFGSKIIEIKMKIEKLIDEKNILSNYQPLHYIREVNNLLKHNIKFQLMREIYLSVRGNTLPFTNILPETTLECQNNIQYHFYRAYSSYVNHLNRYKMKNLNTKATITITSVQSVEPVDEKIDISEFHSSPEKITILKNVLRVELEKLILKEGISHYINQINSTTNSTSSIAQVEVDSISELKSKPVENKSATKQDFLSFLYAFTNKILNKGLFIDVLNVGECVVIPTVDLEHELFSLNSTILEYFDQMKYETQQKYSGKISILQNELGYLNKEYLKVTQLLEYAKKDQERIIEARVAEINSRLIFENDMLKKRIKYILEEQDFSMRELREKVRIEFRTKILDNEISLKKMNNKYHEYREGMSFDIRKFIEGEKNNTLKMIREKKNQIFNATQPRELNGELHNPFDFENFHDSEMVEKLYVLLKKTRILYKFREVVLIEQHEEKIKEMQKQLLANQDLLNKVNDLQNTEKNLKEDLTEAKKELAVVENHNNVLRKHLHHDQKQKLRLYKKNNESRYEHSELQTQLDNVIKQKAIYFSSPRIDTTASIPGGTNNNNNNNSSKYHFSTGRLLSAQGRKNTGDSLEFNTFKNSAFEDILSTDPLRRVGTTQISTARPKTLFESPIKKVVTTTEANESKFNTEPATDNNRVLQNSSSIMKSFIDVKSPINQNLYGFNIKTGKKVKRNDSKGFLVKKYNGNKA